MFPRTPLWLSTSHVHVFTCDSRYAKRVLTIVAAYVCLSVTLSDGIIMVQAKIIKSSLLSQKIQF